MLHRSYATSKLEQFPYPSRSDKTLCVFVAGHNWWACVIESSQQSYHENSEGITSFYPLKWSYAYALSELCHLEFGAISLSLKSLCVFVAGHNWWACVIESSQQSNHVKISLVYIFLDLEPYLCLNGAMPSWSWSNFPVSRSDKTLCVFVAGHNWWACVIESSQQSNHKKLRGYY